MTPLPDLLICLRFFSRLPVPATRREIELGTSGLAAAAAMTPLAGLVLAVVPILVLIAARGANIPSGVAASLAIGSLVLATGALHEDALADCADGFGGGRTAARKLEIMRDSRIGAFGAVAMTLCLFIRIVALAAVLDHGQSRAIAALILAAALSRTACLAPLVLLPPARSEGAGASVARPDLVASIGAVAMALGIAICVALIQANAARVLTATAIAGIEAVAICAIAWRQIGGQTGDVAGATQQLTEASILIVFSASP